MKAKNNTIFLVGLGIFLIAIGFEFGHSSDFAKSNQTQTQQSTTHTSDSTVINTSYYDIGSLSPNAVNILDFQSSALSRDLAAYIRDSVGFDSMNGTGQMPGEYSTGTYGNGWFALTLDIQTAKNPNKNNNSLYAPYSGIKKNSWSITDQYGNQWNVYFNPYTRIAEYEFAISPSGKIIKPLDKNADSLVNNTPFSYSTN